MKYEIYNNIIYKEIEKKEHVSSLVAKAIEAYDLKHLDKEFKSSYEYEGIKELVTYLFNAMKMKKKIIIYGDYDVDGICSVSILKRMFSLLGYEVNYYLPNRYIDGYGLNIDATQKIIDKGYNCIICIDNGIKANEAIKLAKDNGVDVIVLDHHNMGENLPSYDYMLHPNLSSFANYNMCASSIAFYLSRAMLGEDDEICLILAGIATLADVMPLVSQNRLLVKKAIETLNKTHYKPIRLLCLQNEYDENDINMQINPKLNSVGRVINNNSINLLVDYLLANNNDLNNIANYIESCNNKRKNIVDEFLKSNEGNNYDKVIILDSDNLCEGVCGVIASRLANKYNLPSFVMSINNEFYKGSARSIEGINLDEIFNKLDYLVAFGGHKKAAGFTIKKEDLTRFRNDIINLVSKYEIKEKVYKVIKVFKEEINYDSYLKLQMFSPFGEENPKPLFILEDISPSLITFSKDKKHLFIKLNDDVTLLGFNLACKYEEKYNRYRAIFTLDKNNMFNKKLGCKCIDIQGG